MDELTIASNEPFPPFLFGGGGWIIFEIIGLQKKIKRPMTKKNDFVFILIIEFSVKLDKTR